MGGFTLKGPNYTFKSVIENKADACLCLGVYREIDLQTEQLLLNNPSKIISDKLIYSLSRGDEHIGAGRSYTVALRKK